MRRVAALVRNLPAEAALWRSTQPVEPQPAAPPVRSISVSQFREQFHETA